MCSGSYFQIPAYQQIALCFKRRKFLKMFSVKLKVLSFVTEAIVDLLPSPLDIPEERAEKLLCSASRRFDSLHSDTQKLKKGMQFFASTVFNCQNKSSTLFTMNVFDNISDFLVCSSGEDAPTILFVSKMFTCDRKALPQNRQR